MVSYGTGLFTFNVSKPTDDYPPLSISDLQKLLKEDSNVAPILEGKANIGFVEPKDYKGHEYADHEAVVLPDNFNLVKGARLFLVMA